MRKTLYFTISFVSENRNIVTLKQTMAEYSTDLGLDKQRDSCCMIPNFNLFRLTTVVHTFSSIVKVMRSLIACKFGRLLKFR